MIENSVTSATVADGRARIDEIDAALIGLIRERIAVSRGIQGARIAEGGPRVVSSREQAVVQKWHRALGESGAVIALRLLDLSRGHL